MNKKDRELITDWKRQIIKLQRQLQILFNEMEEAAQDIEARVMKKTTQRSPEWFGGANC